MISGYTGGIGTAVADLLRSRGDEIIPVVRDRGKLGDEVKRVVQADLSRPETIAPGVEELGLTSLDALIHCAGVIRLGGVAGTPVESWTEQLNVNLVAPAELTRSVLPALRAAHGHVVFVNFWIGPAAKPGWSAYAASKFGLKALADALRGEEFKQGVSVTSVHPACVATDMQRGVRETFGMPYQPDHYIQPSTVAGAIRSALDAPPDARVTDIILDLPYVPEQ
jgi:NAD(P)-dependent dehydrogenase (short-subunit alcohol dehydrogenase family)